MTSSFLRPDEKKRYRPGVLISGRYVFAIVFALAPCVYLYLLFPKLSYGMVVIYTATVFLCAQIISVIGNRIDALERKLGESRDERRHKVHEILGEKRPHQK